MKIDIRDIPLEAIRSAHETLCLEKCKAQHKVYDAGVTRDDFRRNVALGKHVKELQEFIFFVADLFENENISCNQQSSPV